MIASDDGSGARGGVDGDGHDLGNGDDLRGHGTASQSDVTMSVLMSMECSVGEEGKTQDDDSGTHADQYAEQSDYLSIVTVSNFARWWRSVVQVKGVWWQIMPIVVVAIDERRPGNQNC